MLVRQAIVCSPKSRALKNNELISRSKRIDDELARKLCDWSPGRRGLEFGYQQGISFYQVDADTFAFSRSVGGLDNYHDNERSVVSQVILFDRDQLNSYNANIAVLAHVIRSTGLMIVPTSISDELPLLEIPERAFEQLGELFSLEFAEQFESVAHAVELHHRVVVLGLMNPLSFMCSFLSNIPQSTRLEFSFATGLKIEDHKHFASQFLSDTQPDLIKDLASRQIRTIQWGPQPVIGY